MNRTRTRSITIPVVVTLLADAFGDHVVDTTMAKVDDTHPVFNEHGEQLIAPNTVAVAKRHVAAMILRSRVPV